MLKGLYKANIMTHPELKNLKFNLENMRTNFEDFQYRIGAIANLQAGDKLGMYVHTRQDTEYHVFTIWPAGSLQFIQRWWSGESRKQTLVHLKKNFLEYVQFVDMCVDATRIHVYDNSYLQLCYENIKFQDEIHQGLENLKKTYLPDAEEKEDEDAKKICKYINVILDTFYEFKTHIIRRAYRRLYRKQFTERFDEIALKNTTMNGVDLVMNMENIPEEETAEVKTPTPCHDERSERRERTKTLPDTLEKIAEEYPGHHDELKRHMEAVERGEEETSSYYDSEEGDHFEGDNDANHKQEEYEEQEYTQQLRKRIKTHHEQYQELTKQKRKHRRKKNEVISSMASLDEPKFMK